MERAAISILCWLLFLELGICVKIWCKDIQNISQPILMCMYLIESRINVNNIRRKTTPLENDHFSLIEQCRIDEFIRIIQFESG